MPQEAIGAARHWRRARNDDDPRVPAPPERRDGPPAERLGAEGHGQRNQPWSPRKRPLQDEHLGRARDRKEGVDHDHNDVGAAPRLDTARRQNLAGIPARDEKLRAPLADEKAQKPSIEQDRRGGYHCRRTSSEQKPGPIAIRSPRSPFTGSSDARSSPRTKSTDADERFPVSFSDLHERARAPSGSSSALSNVWSALPQKL